MYLNRTLLRTFGSLIYKKVHKTEYFDKNEKFNFKIKGKTAWRKPIRPKLYFFVKHKKKL